MAIASRIKQLREIHRAALLDDCLPFWMRHSPDEECGGYFTCLGRDGSVYDPDKLCLWGQGRLVWVFAYMHAEHEARPEWLDMARRGVEFLREFGFAPDGRMYYALTRDGRPLQVSQDVFAELSAVCGFAAFARAAEDEGLYLDARRIFLGVWARIKKRCRANHPFLAQTRPARIHGHSMIALNALQELRAARAEPEYDRMIDECVSNIVKFHLRRDRRCLLEVVGWEGEDLPGSQGGRINPGHMMEAGIFLIREARHRGDAGLSALGVELVEWGFEWGWDGEFGGIFNDVHEQGQPFPGSEALLAPCKLWWQHAEALYALLLAYAETGRREFFYKYELVHRYSFSQFADPKHGEWFGLLDRRGHRMNDAKGTARKSAYHLARNLYHCYVELGRL